MAHLDLSLATLQNTTLPLPSFFPPLHTFLSLVYAPTFVPHSSAAGLSLQFLSFLLHLFAFKIHTMGDNSKATTFNTDPAANPPDAAALEKGKGKAVEETPATQDVSMDEDEESSEEESGPEEMVRLSYLTSVLCGKKVFCNSLLTHCHAYTGRR